jgi:N-acetylneuraminate synthase
MIVTLKRLFAECPIGYSGHEADLSPTLATIPLGATFIERHVTLNRSMWGSDQAASVDLPTLNHLVAAIREIERALGDGVKRIYPGELPQMAKLRRVGTSLAEAS